MVRKIGVHDYHEVARAEIEPMDVSSPGEHGQSAFNMHGRNPTQDQVFQLAVAKASGSYLVFPHEKYLRRLLFDARRTRR